jgi:UDP-N-acetylmuramate dehydrogenase
VVQEQIIVIFTVMIAVHQNQQLKALNSFGLGTRAAYYCRPDNVETLGAILKDKHYSHMPQLVLGEGSNILFRNDFEGLVIQPGMKGVEIVEENHEKLIVKVGSSENWDSWVVHALERGWFGLENLSLIPGSVGAAPVQNIGAYGVELRDRFAWLEAWDLQDYKPVRLHLEDCHFGYRNSIFKEEGKGRYIITHVAFSLNKKPQLNLDYGKVKNEFLQARGKTSMDLRSVIINIRRSKLPDPEEYGNAGSFFKNPLVDKTIYNCIRVEYPDIPFFPGEHNQMKVPAAWLIEQAGWKGKRLGNVGTWPSQALVIVNYGGATGQEVYDFSQKIMEDVEAIFGVTLEREVNVI